VSAVADSPPGSAPAVRVVPPGEPALAPVPGGLPIGWWGLAWLVATEAMLFGGLLSAWFFTRAASRTWPQGGIEPPELGRITFFTIVLLGSSLPLIYGERAIKQGHVRRLRVALAVSFVMGAAFLINQIVDYRDLTFGIRDNAYASLFYATTGLHGMHVAIGLAVSLAVQVKVAAGRIDADHHLSVRVFSLYWHFVDVVWIAVFSSLYLSTHVR
jgi:heme/copper-type cytochrome/quinol oxidase subunit 3